jgi:hypothetical protein
LDRLVREAKARFDALSTEEQAAHQEAQRQSWVRGEAAMAESAVRREPAAGETTAANAGGMGRAGRTAGQEGTGGGSPDDVTQLRARVTALEAALVSILDLVAHPAWHPSPKATIARLVMIARAALSGETP